MWDKTRRRLGRCLESCGSHHAFMWGCAALPRAPQVKRCFVIPHSITTVSVLTGQPFERSAPDLFFFLPQLSHALNSNDCIRSDAQSFWFGIFRAISPWIIKCLTHLLPRFNTCLCMHKICHKCVWLLASPFENDRNWGLQLLNYYYCVFQPLEWSHVPKYTIKWHYHAVNANETTAIRNEMMQMIANQHYDAHSVCRTIVKWLFSMVRHHQVSGGVKGPISYPFPNISFFKILLHRAALHD